MNFWHWNIWQLGCKKKATVSVLNVFQSQEGAKKIFMDWINAVVLRKNKIFFTKNFAICIALLSNFCLYGCEQNIPIKCFWYATAFSQDKLLDCNLDLKHSGLSSSRKKSTFDFAEHCCQSTFLRFSLEKIPIHEGVFIVLITKKVAPVECCWIRPSWKRSRP